MISIVVTLEDKSVINLTADHINLRQETGISMVNGVPQLNGQSRFNIQGITGVPNYADFKTEITTEVNK